MIAIKNAIIDKYLQCNCYWYLLIDYRTWHVRWCYSIPSEWWRCGGAPHICKSQVTHQGFMTRNQRWKKDIQISCAKMVHIWDAKTRWARSCSWWPQVTGAARRILNPFYKRIMKAIIVAAKMGQFTTLYSSYTSEK